MGLVTVIANLNGSMKGNPVKIMVHKNVVPYCTPTARHIPFPILPKVKKELQHSEKDDIIESHQINGLVLTDCSSKKKTQRFQDMCRFKNIKFSSKMGIFHATEF